MELLEKLTGKNTDMNPLLEAFQHELKDIYWAEQAIVKALPKMAKAAKSEELTAALESHLEETKRQVKRLESVFKIAGLEADAKKCDGMNGILKEGDKVVGEFSNSPALDAVIIAACQKVEHYEIASYGTLRSYASQLGLDDAVALLQETIDEEGEADKKLTDIALSLSNLEAEHGADDQEQK